MTCRRCGGSTVPWVSARDRDGGPPVAVVRCVAPGCGVGQTLGDLRAVAAPPSWSAGFIARRLAGRQLRAAGVAMTGAGRAVDIGAGAGLRSDVLAAAGMDVVAVEPDPTEADRLAARLGGRVRVIAAPLGPRVLEPCSADLVIAWHVLEHLPDLDAALAEMVQALVPGGHLVIAVPNAASREARLLAGRWHGWDPARHRWHLTPATLERVLATAGLSRIAVRAAGTGGPATSLGYSLLPGLDHQRHPGRRFAGLALVGACAPAAAALGVRGGGAQVIASAVREPDYVSPRGGASGASSRFSSAVTLPAATVRIA